jgi:DNA-binding transcriptional LysR family regulator
MCANAGSGCLPYDPSMDLQRLRIFREVARCGSVTAAAESLTFAQPVVSRHIAALEREVGARLLVRLPRGVRLTEAGRIFLEHTQVILDRAAVAQQQVQAACAGEAGRLALAAIPSANARLMPSAIARFNAHHPAVDLSLDEAWTVDAIPRVLAGEIDLAIVSAHDEATHAQLGDVASAHLLDDQFLVALSAAHPLATQARLTLRQLQHESWIEVATPPAHSKPLATACATAGFEPRIRFRSDHWSGRMGLVASGIGIALLPRLGYGGGRDDIVLRPVTPQPPIRRIYAIWADGPYHAPAVEPMLDALRQAATDVGSDPVPGARRAA